MYNIAIYIYMLGVAIISLFDSKVKKMWRGEREAFDTLRRKVDPKARYVWFHAASLGEFEQGRPLMERLHAEHPELKILLTFFSPSGYEVRKDYAVADIVCYLPLDTRRNALRFLRLVKPEMAFFIKYEFWYNYLHILKHRGIPTYSVASIFRPGQVFFRWYARTYARVLRCFTHFYVQNEVSRELLATDRLFYFECCELARLGCTSYDLMGIGSDFSPSLLGLNTFKTKFAKDGERPVAPDRDLPVRRAFYRTLVGVRDVRDRLRGSSEE